jgi:multidrug/hemolysin transport system permease protein
MKALVQLTKRNLLQFFRNRSEVFFSFLSVIIILGLYLLFLSDQQVRNIEYSIGQSIEGIKPMVNAWVMAGLLAVSTVTLSIGALGRMVLDKNRKVFYDFMVAPIKRYQLFLSYITSTFLIVLMISITIVIISQVYIVFSGGEWFSLDQWLRLSFYLLLCIISSTFMVLFIVSFIENPSVMSTFATVVGTLIGFVTGAYIPMGVLPKGVQIVSNLMPVSQGASLLRQVFMESSMHQVFAGAPEAAVLNYMKFQGIDLYIGDTLLTPTIMVIYLIVSTLIFILLNYWRFQKMKNN